MEFINTDETIEINNLDQMSLKQYQEYIKNQLQVLYRQNEIKTEWNAMKGQENLIYIHLGLMWQLDFCYL